MPRIVSQAFSHLKSKSVSSLDVVTDRLTTTTVDAKQASFGTLVVGGKPIVASETGTVLSNESTTGDFLVNGNLSVKGDVKNTAGTDLNIGDPLTVGSSFIRPQLPLILQPDGNDARNIRMQAFKNASNNIQFQLKSVNTISASDTSSNGAINLFSDANTETVNTSQSSTNVSYITQLEGGTLIDGDVLVGKATRKDIYAKQLNCATIDTTGEAKLTALSVSGASSTGSLAVSGVSTVGSLNVGSGKFQVDGSGDTQVNGALSVADGKVTTLGGATTIKGTLAVKDPSGNVSHFEVDSNGDTKVGGALTVADGKTTTLGGALTVADGKVTTLGGAADVKGTLAVKDASGNTSFSASTDGKLILRSQDGKDLSIHTSSNGHAKIDCDSGILEVADGIYMGGSGQGPSGTGFSITQNGTRLVIIGNDTGPSNNDFAPQMNFYQTDQKFDPSGNEVYRATFTGNFLYENQLFVGTSTKPGLSFSYNVGTGVSQITPHDRPNGYIQFLRDQASFYSGVTNSNTCGVNISNGAGVRVNGDLFVGPDSGGAKSVKCRHIFFVEPNQTDAVGTSKGIRVNSSNGLLELFNNNGTSGYIVTTTDENNVSGNLSAPSDDRLKHNETDIKNATETLKKIKPYVYDMTETFLPADYKGPLDQKTTPYHKESGFIAQDVEKIPELAHLVTPGDEKTPYKLKYDGFMAFIVQACQEMSTELDTVKSAHSDTRAQLETLQKSHTSALSENAQLTSQVEALSKVQAELMVRIEALEKNTSSTSA